MNKKIIQNFAWWVGILIVSFGLIPFLINVIGTNVAIKSGASFSDWLSFWGSYLGGFVTLVGVYLAFKLEERKEIKQSIYIAGREINSIEFAMTEFLRICEYGKLVLNDVDKLMKEIKEASESKAIHYTILLRLHDIEKDLRNLRTPLVNIDFFNEKISSSESKKNSLEENEIQEENSLEFWTNHLTGAEEETERLKASIKKKITELMDYIKIFNA